MALWVIWTAAFYLLLKVLRVAFGPRAGLEPQEFNFRAAARMGEPTVLIEAVLISLCATLYVQWSTTRLGAREIGHSTICYGQLAAAGRLPGFAKAYRVDAVDYTKRIYRGVAEQHAPWVKMSDETIDTLLGGARRHYEEYYVDIVSKGDRKSIAREFKEIERCLNDDWEPHGEFFNP